jgi:hypothetical protein
VKPVMQTVFGEDGNCMQACIASLLGLPLEEVPQFPIHGQFFAVERYLKQFDIRPVGYPVEKMKLRPYNVYYISTGLSERGLRHAVVCKDGLMIHDPHPDGTGVEPDIDYYFFKMFHGGDNE